ncbi:MAG: MBL fold metallo-hydrolase [Mycoplasmatales bacterium]
MKVIALGGIEENGKNCYIVETKEDLVIIDMGSKKYDNVSLGVDTVVNDLEYLISKKDKIRGVLVSHTHHQHMGGIEYLIKEIQVPIYGSKYTIEYLKNDVKYQNYQILNEHRPLKLGNLTVENFKLSHSVFGHLGFLIAQGKEAVVYATDYNFNQSAKKSTRTDIEKIIKLKNHYNIKLLLTEAKFADHHGVASGDLSFLPAFNRLTENLQGKLFITLYSDNISGMTNIIKIAAKHKKKIVIIGKKLLTYVNVSKKLGYIDHVSDTFIKVNDIDRYAPSEVIVIVSGDFLEPFETLESLAKKHHPITTIMAKDTVMIASEPSDEIEGIVQQKLDQVSRTHCYITHLKVDVSDHAHEEDIKMMLNFFEPEYIIPINAEYRKLKKIQEIAKNLSYKEDKVKLISNGDVVDIDQNVNIIDTVKTESKLVNKDSKETVAPMLLFDRENLTQEGYVLITLIVDKKNKKLVQDPEVLSGGLMSFDDDENLISKCVEIVKKELKDQPLNDNLSKVKNKVKRFLNNKIGKSPVILTVKIEVK